jgi:hypothetical protein
MKLNRIAPLRGARGLDCRSKSPKKFLTGYETGHLLTEEFSSAQKEKHLSGYRRDYSTESLVKYSSNHGSAVKTFEQKEPISPYNSGNKQPLGQKRVSYDINIDPNTNINRNLAMKYYSNERTYK